MGVVYEVEDPQLPRRLALKTFLIPRGDERLRKRFQREAESLAKVSHRNVIRIHRVGAWEGGLYLTMDCVEGETLADRVERDGPYDPEDAAHLLAQLARAIGAVHEAELLHRDLKPQNVMFRPEDGEPLLLDFGLALDRSQERLTSTGTLLGTPIYMSPEQAAGQKELTPAVDVYGLGTLLYFTLVGKSPYTEENLAGLLQQILEGSIVPLERRRPELPPELIAICMRALAVDSVERFGSAAEFADALEEFLEGGSKTAFSGSGKVGLVGAAVLALIALAVLAFFVLR